MDNSNWANTKSELRYKEINEKEAWAGRKNGKLYMDKMFVIHSSSSYNEI